MGNVANVSYGKPKIGGAIHRAPVGTPLPTDATSELNNAFKELGYISDDGLTNENKIETEEVKAWGGDTVLTPQKGKTDKMKFKLIEVLNEEVLKTVYGEKNVQGNLSEGISVDVRTEELEDSAWVIEMIMKGGVLKRIVVPKASISELSEIVYKDNEATGYEITLSAAPDKNGSTHKEYIIKSNEVSDEGTEANNEEQGVE